VPPLRERKEDILPLARRFLAFFSRSMQRPRVELTPDAEAALLAYAWPGNVRELKNAVERALIVSSAQMIDRAALPERVCVLGVRLPTVGGDCTIDELEREHIEAVVRRSKTLEEAAVVLGIDTSTLWRKRRRYET
jgi:NtrC-family two-component system response regulator AlgB